MKSFIKNILVCVFGGVSCIVQAADQGSWICPEIPAGSIVLGRYCVQETAKQEVVAHKEVKQATPPQLQIAETSKPAQELPAVTEVATSTAPLTPTAQPLWIREGERLRPALKTWLNAQSIELVWAASATTSGRVRDVILEDEFRASSLDVREALTEILSPFGFEAELAKNSGSLQRVTVRNSRNGL